MPKNRHIGGLRYNRIAICAFQLQNEVLDVFMLLPAYYIEAFCNWLLSNKKFLSCRPTFPLILFLHITPGVTCCKHRGATNFAEPPSVKRGKELENRRFVCGQVDSIVMSFRFLGLEIKYTPICVITTIEQTIMRTDFFNVLFSKRMKASLS